MLLYRYWIPIVLVLSLHALLMAWLLRHRVATSATPPLEHIMQVLLETPPIVVVNPSLLPKSQQQTKPVVISPAPMIHKPTPKPTPPPEATASAIALPPHASSVPEPFPPSPPQEEKVTPPSIDASYKGNAAPSYPRISKALGEAGVVMLKIFVNTDGTVGQVQLEKSSGYARLDHAAEEAISHWKLLPARRGNQPIAIWYALPINFNLTAEN